MSESIENFLTLQKQKLAEEKRRLNSAPLSQRRKSSEPVLIKSKSFNDKSEIIAIGNQNNSKMDYSKGREVNMDFSPACTDLNTCRTVDPFQLYDEIVTKSSNREENVKILSMGGDQQKPVELTKHEKEAKNERRSSQDSRHRKPQEDEMEQWVSDTFYSYFPSFNHIEKKRENLARDRQLDYQNYLKQAAEVPQKNRRNRLKSEDENSSRATKTNDKSEVEIIVTNPTYVDKNKESNNNNLVRPPSTKQRLLQDLKHTELSNIVNTNAVQERNRSVAELDAQKKMEYQKELIRQIEEKRREIEILKEKEKHEEEILTKRLEEQLKTMQLEQELEREKVKTEKTRLANEQNHILRVNLISKLENDHKLYNPYSERQTQSENGKDNNNKVYKYFSNSARHDYKKYARKTFLEPYNLESSTDIPKDIPTRSTICKHCRPNYDDIFCSFCKTNLRTKENLCVRCGKNVSEDDDESNRQACESCKEQYFICGDCEKRNTPCIFCHRRRNVCHDCLKNLCMHCNRSMDGKISSRSTASRKSVPTVNADFHQPKKANSMRSFRVLDSPYQDSDDDDFELELEDIGPEFFKKKRPPYSMNLEKNSIFHPDSKFTEPKVELNIKNGEVFVNKFNDTKFDLEAMKHKTNDRLSRYMKNYGDLTNRKERFKTKGTQTSVETTTAVPAQELLSMPLLRQTPPVRKQSNENEKRTEEVTSPNMAVLSHKWEIPAVQKYTISSGTQPVLTQLGAIRRQLQLEQLDLDKAVVK